MASPHALYLTLLNPLDQSGFQTALAGLEVAAVKGGYRDEKLRLALVCLQVAGVLRMAHINDQPITPWGVVIDRARRPDGDTLDQYLNQLITLDEEEAGDVASAERLGRIRPDGMIAQAQQASLRGWAEAGLLTDDVWRFDGHTVEYSGQVPIGKTKHGTKDKSVPAIDRYTLYNGICALTDYFPTCVSYDEALCSMVHKANQALPEAQRIRKLCFDKEGWNTQTLKWLSKEAGIVPIVWVKNTKPNIDSLTQIPDHAFVPVQNEMVIGKSHKRQVERIADTRVWLPHLGDSRVVVLETSDQQRVGIYTSAPAPAESRLADDQCMSAVDVLEAVRLQQHVENGFKVDVHEMGCDAIPTHKTLTVNLVEPYDLDQAQKQLANAHKRLDKYSHRLDDILPQLQEESALDRHDLKHLTQRSQRLQHKARQEIETLAQEMESVQVADDGSATRRFTCQVLDLRKMTLFTLFKAHALVALRILASQLGLTGAGPVRLRREFLAHGHRVEFDPQRRLATVYAHPFPRARTQEAYERLCALLHDAPITLTRNGVSYRVRFSY